MDGLDLRELPEVWNEAMSRYLGVDVPDDAHGVLQDVHWSRGGFGYFPTYSLGNVMSVQIWERLRDDLPEPDASVDVVFCFAAAHHFGTHRRTLAEIHRVLRAGGVAHYFYEPACPAYLHRAASWRVTHKRPEVPEDVLVYSRLIELGREVGLSAEVSFYPTFRRRGSVETLYYATLTALPPLRRALPCTANFSFRKGERA